MKPKKIKSFFKDPYQLGWWNFGNLNLFLPNEGALKSKLSGRTTEFLKYQSPQKSEAKKFQDRHT